MKDYKELEEKIVIYIFRHFKGLYNIEYLEKCSTERLIFLLNTSYNILKEDKKQQELEHKKILENNNGNK